ncbi:MULTISPECIES: MerR family transcriptional regulator [Saccharibacillus]|uniref:MerR family transcriptional regulator n=1 Tax=Saccharibacillus brassicae TaxID=2583377 RepID=A0A4Y6UY52_SACBS|nr:MULTISPECIES: MerR family transcriptional regulator [Saccharibacillus]MWJ33487.1 MerR family transcriptional regulator [Saccharibacillus sp. WB 17]QDH22682.1 MerR family transcriptional regulator [Saccharibacillus brassicae]
MKLFRIGELAKAAGTSERTIDYYTKLGLICPQDRSMTNYRLYGPETLLRLTRIHELKNEKFTLEEIREKLDKWSQATEDDRVSEKLTLLESHLAQVEKELKELQPMLQDLDPAQARKTFSQLVPQGIACMEAIKLLLGQNPMM